MNKALFLDRDGVMNEDIGFLYRSEDCHLIDGIASLVRTANRRGYVTCVITNQSGIGRGLYTEADFHTLMKRMSLTLQEQDARLDAVYFSPYHPVHGIGPYQRESDCRKPGPGMLLREHLGRREKHRLVFGSSFSSVPRKSSHAHQTSRIMWQTRYLLLRLT